MNRWRTGILALVVVVAAGLVVASWRATAGPPGASPSGAATATPSLAASASAGPTPLTPTPTATASAALPSMPAPPPAARGWTTLGELAGTSGGTTTYAAPLPKGHRVALIAISCTGEGAITLRSDEPTGIDRRVPCADAGSASPVHVSSLFLDGDAVAFDLAPEGAVAWRMRVQSAPGIVPDHRLVTGTTAWIEACGGSYHTFYGVETSDSCGALFFAEDLPTIAARDGAVRASIDGWTMHGVEVACGRLADEGRDFAAASGCTPRVARTGDDSVRVTGLPQGGRWLVRVSTELSDAEGNALSLQYFAWVRT